MICTRQGRLSSTGDAVDFGLSRVASTSVLLLQIVGPSGTALLRLKVEQKWSYCTEKL